MIIDSFRKRRSIIFNVTHEYANNNKRFRYTFFKLAWNIFLSRDVPYDLYDSNTNDLFVY